MYANSLNKQLNPLIPLLFYVAIIYIHMQSVRVYVCVKPIHGNPKYIYHIWFEHILLTIIAEQL